LKDIRAENAVIRRLLTTKNGAYLNTLISEKSELERQYAELQDNYHRVLHILVECKQVTEHFVA